MEGMGKNDKVMENDNKNERRKGMKGGNERRNERRKRMKGENSEAI